MKKCKHEWRYECDESMGFHQYFYCVHCLAQARLRDGTNGGARTYSVEEAENEDE